MNISRSVLFVFLVVVLSGCSYPVSNVNQGGERPALVFKGSNASAQLYLDGLHVGSVTKYNGKPNKLLVEKGAHKLRIVDNGEVVYEQSILVTQGETKVIKIAD